MKPKTLSIITQKGGVGKTTSTIHIGGALANLGYKVLLIDFDTQMNLSLGNNIEDSEYTIYQFLTSNAKPVYSVRGEDNRIKIIAGSDELKEKKLNKNSLEKAINRIKNDFDFILIDCPPKPINDELTFGEIAVTASDYVLSPIKSDKYSIKGISSFIRSLNGLKYRSAVRAELLGFFFNEVEPKTVHFNNYYSLLKDSPASSLLMDNYIRKDVNIKNAMDEGKTIFEIKPFGRAARDFKDLTNEILTKIENNEQSKK